MGKNRDRLSLLAAIMQAASEGSNKTRIMYAANLSYKLLEKYLDEALDMSFLHLAGSTYLVTERGQEFLRKHAEFSDHFGKVRKVIDELALEREALEKFCRKNAANCLLTRQV